MSTSDIPVVDITDGGPDMVQMLNADGERVEVNTERYAAYASSLDAEALRGFYRDMMLVRRTDAEGFALQRQGQLGLWPGLVGQEAAQIGAGRAMRPQDWGFPGYREHGISYCKGVPYTQLLGLFRGVNHGGWSAHEFNYNTYTIVIGNQMLNAVGMAMGAQLDGDVGTGDPDRDVAVMAFTGDGGTSQGDFNEALNFAAVNGAPCVFFVQNNHWAISEPNSRQFRIPPYRRADGFGMPGVRVDGNDVVATYAVTSWALEHARSGQGPVLIEAFTYRMGSHTTSDDPTKYRLAAEVELWRAKDPVSRLKAHLVANKMADDAFFAQVDADADAHAAELREACMTMPNPSMPDMFDHVYAEPHTLVDEQRAEFVDYFTSLEEH